MDKHRQSISDKLLKPEHHDPYLKPWHQRSDTLCPQCGANLNQTTCSCDQTWVDPRLAALKALVPDRPPE